MKVVIPRTVCREKNKVFSSPRSQYWWYDQTFWDGKPHVHAFEVLELLYNRSSWLIVKLSNMCSKNLVFLSISTSTLIKKQRFLNTHLILSQLVMSFDCHKSSRTSKACPGGFPSQKVWSYFQYWLRGLEKTLFFSLQTVLGITTFIYKV